MINLSIQQIRALLACTDANDFRADGRYIWVCDRFAFATNRVVALLVRHGGCVDGQSFEGFFGVPVGALDGRKGSMIIIRADSRGIEVEEPYGPKFVMPRDDVAAPNIHKIIPQQISGQAAYMSASTWAIAEKVRKLVANKGGKGAKPPALCIRPNGMDAPSIIELGNPDYLMLAAPCKMAIDGPWDRPDWL